MPSRPIVTCVASLLAILMIGADRAGKAPAVPEGIDAHFDLNYGNKDDKSQLLDVYLPKNATGKLPVILDIHGGGWSGGGKRPAFATQFVKDGYAVVSVEYRFSQVAKFPAQIHDCKAAVRWIRAHADEFHFDADHIGAWGDSAGGHLVALLGTTANVKELEGDEGNPNFSSAVQAVCDFYGPTDFLSMASQELPEATLHPEDPGSPVSQLLGGPASQNTEIAKAASPITYVTKNAAPFLIVQGDKDLLVPLAQSEELRDALKKVGVPVELYVVRGGGHGFPQTPELTAKMKSFFDSHLKSDSKPVSPGK